MLRFGASHDKSPPYLFGWDISNANGKLTYVFCHVTSCDHMFKGLCDFMGGSPSE